VKIKLNRKKIKENFFYPNMTLCNVEIESQSLCIFHINNNVSLNFIDLPI
jgi:hypothetical protein